MSKKIGSAVRRNRVKRVLREFFRLHQTQLPQATDFVVVPKRQLKPEHVTLALVCHELLPLVEEVRGRILSLRAANGSAQSAPAAPTKAVFHAAGDMA